MNFKKTPASPRGHSGVLNEDADDAFELTLYDELVAFSESPESERDFSDDDFGIAEVDPEPPDIELPEAEMREAEIEAAPVATEGPDLLSQPENPSLEDFEALEDLANAAARPVTNRPIERLEARKSVV